VLCIRFSCWQLIIRKVIFSSLIAFNCGWLGFRHVAGLQRKVCRIVRSRINRTRPKRGIADLTLLTQFLVTTDAVFRLCRENPNQFSPCKLHKVLCSALFTSALLNALSSNDMFLILKHEDAYPKSRKMVIFNFCFLKIKKNRKPPAQSTCFRRVPCFCYPPHRRHTNT
jgi:hypothetical protein